MGEEKNLSETDLISRESGAQFESLPEMTLTTRLILGECQMEISEILKLGVVRKLLSDGRIENYSIFSDISF